MCPENCLSLIPLNEFNFSGETKALLGEQAQYYSQSLQHLEAGPLGATEGSVMVKDETICIRCGLCAERCPAHTITMEAFEVFDHELDLIPIKETVLGK